eukprot:TRINITY_DN56751_c0_g1_i1.p1 TRINITY_DN56751_c0_g1~~TRINITY_DN56751_c0_g1_i1.p1  ORF type:complete len:161 (-),score=18.82 TRINITY_DN56751_c0_g1_i1:97-579(-)
MMKRHMFLCALVVTASMVTAQPMLPPSMVTPEEFGSLQLLTCTSSLCFTNDTRTFQCSNAAIEGLFPVPEQAPVAVLLLAEESNDLFTDLEARYMALVPKSRLAEGTLSFIPWRPTTFDPAPTQCLALGGIGRPFGTCCGPCSFLNGNQQNLSCCRACQA